VKKKCSEVGTPSKGKRKPFQQGKQRSDQELWFEFISVMYKVVAGSVLKSLNQNVASEKISFFQSQS